MRIAGNWYNTDNLRKAAYVIGIIACLLAAEGLHRFATLIRTLGMLFNRADDGPFYMVMLAASLFCAVLFVLAWINKLTRIMKWGGFASLLISIIVILGAHGISPDIPVIRQIIISLIVGLICLPFAEVSKAACIDAVEEQEQSSPQASASGDALGQLLDDYREQRITMEEFQRRKNLLVGGSKRASGLSWSHAIILIPLVFAGAGYGLYSYNQHRIALRRERMEQYRLEQEATAREQLRQEEERRRQAAEERRLAHERELRLANEELQRVIQQDQ